MILDLFIAWINDDRAASFPVDMGEFEFGVTCWACLEDSTWTPGK